MQLSNTSLAFASINQWILYCEYVIETNPARIFGELFSLPLFLCLGGYFTVDGIAHEEYVAITLLLEAFDTHFPNEEFDAS